MKAESDFTLVNIGMQEWKIGFVAFQESNVLFKTYKLQSISVDKEIPHSS